MGFMSNERHFFPQGLIINDSARVEVPDMVASPCIKVVKSILSSWADLASREFSVFMIMSHPTCSTDLKLLDSASIASSRKETSNAVTIQGMAHEGRCRQREPTDLSSVVSHPTTRFDFRSFTLSRFFPDIFIKKSFFLFLIWTCGQFFKKTFWFFICLFFLKITFSFQLSDTLSAIHEWIKNFSACHSN